MQKKTPFRFNKTSVSALPNAAEGKRDFYRDASLPGFHVQVTSNGAKTFFARKRIGNKTPRVTIGTFPQMTVEQARKKAGEALALMSADVDPGEQKQKAIEQARTDERTAATVEQILALYNTTYGLRPSTLQSYQSALSTVLGNRFQEPLLSIKTADVTELHAAYHSKARANLAMRALRSLYTFQLHRCDLEEERINPVKAALSRRGKGNRWHKAKRRKTIIQPDQMQAWFDAVESLPTAGYRSTYDGEVARDLYLFQLYTGLRSTSECASLKFDQVDEIAGTIQLDVTKTTSEDDEPIIIPLNSHALAIVNRRPKDNAYVFGHGRAYLKDCRIYKNRVRDLIGWDWIPYDSRRTFLTIGEQIAPVLTVKRLANHASAEYDVTSGYIARDLDHLRDVSQRIADTILRQAQRLPNSVVALRS